MKKNTYIVILGLALGIIALGYVLNIPQIVSLSNQTAKYVVSPYIFVPAAVLCFIFNNHKQYFLLMVAFALITALAVQFFVVGSLGGVYTILVRAFSFLVVVFFLNFLRTLFGK